MMNSPGGQDEQAKLPLGDRIDCVCDEFESCWDANERVTIIDALQQFDGDERETALRELLLVDLEIRFRKQQSPNVDQYIQQFPQYEKIVRDVFDSATQTYADTLVKSNQSDTDNHQRVASRGGKQGEPCPSSIGKYRVIEALERGGQATVYRAVHPELGRDVVIKFVHDSPGINAESEERLRTEGQLLAQLDHPNLARVYDFDFESNRAYLVMEFVRGLNLRQYYRQAAPDYSRCLEIVEQVAGALAYVHQRGVLHLDIKPANILLDESGRPRLIDFGLARTETVWTEAGPDPEFLSGTLSYMSPEQARCESEKIGPASDIYGLGGVLFFLLTGQSPVSGKDFDGLLTRAKNADWDRSRLDDGVPEGARSVCLQAMAAEPEERFATADEMTAALHVLRTPRSGLRAAWIGASIAAAAAVLLGIWAVMSAMNSNTSDDSPPAASSGDQRDTGDSNKDSSKSTAAGNPRTTDREQYESFSSEMRIRVWRDGRFYPLVDSAPVAEGDRVEMRARVPAHVHLFDTEGTLELLESVPPAEAAYELRFPPDESTSAPIVGPPGTELILLCGRRETPVTVEDLREHEDFASAWPQLPNDTVIQLRTAGVDYLQRGRGFGAAVATFDPQQAVYDRLEQLRQRMSQNMDLLEGIAFSHVE